MAFLDRGSPQGMTVLPTDGRQRLGTFSVLTAGACAAPGTEADGRIRGPAPHFQSTADCVWPHASVVGRLTSPVLDENLQWEQRPLAPALGHPLSSRGCFPSGASLPESTVGPAGHLLFTVRRRPTTPPSPARGLGVGQPPPSPYHKARVGSLQDSNQTPGDCSDVNELNCPTTVFRT